MITLWNLQAANELKTDLSEIWRRQEVHRRGSVAAHEDGPGRRRQVRRGEDGAAAVREALKQKEGASDNQGSVCN